MKTPLQMRNEEFRRRCVEIFNDDYRQGKFPTVDSILERAMAKQPRCFYVNYDRASRRLSQIERYGLDVAVKEEESRNMWGEIMGHVQAYLLQNPKASRCTALTFVLNFRRPSRFHISKANARRIIRGLTRMQIVLSRNAS